MKYLFVDTSRTDGLTSNFILKYYKHYFMQVAWCSLVFSKDLGIILYRKHENSRKKYYILDTSHLLYTVLGQEGKNIELNNLSEDMRQRKGRRGKEEKRRG